MKKLALFLCGLGSLAFVSVNAANYGPSETQEPQYQEQCQPVPCAPDTCTQLPCNVPVANTQQPCTPAPCAPDTVCTPVPCYTTANTTYCGC